MSSLIEVASTANFSHRLVFDDCSLSTRRVFDDCVNTIDRFLVVQNLHCKFGKQILTADDWLNAVKQNLQLSLNKRLAKGAH